MFIKLIEIYGEIAQNGKRQYHLREVVVNKKNIIWMVENDTISSSLRHNDAFAPEGININQKYTNLYLSTNVTREVICTVVGDLDYLYKLLETDSALNHRQTLRG